MKISTKEKIKMAQALTAKAIMVSETTKHDIFVYYSPHVDEFDVDVHTDGWKSGVTSDRKFWINLKTSNVRKDYEAAVKALDELAMDKASGAEEESPGDAGASPEPKDNTLNEI